MPNHNGIEEVVIVRALSLYRIMIQLTTERYANNATAPAIMERPSDCGIVGASAKQCEAESWLGQRITAPTIGKTLGFSTSARAANAERRRLHKESHKIALRHRDRLLIAFLI